MKRLVQALLCMLLPMAARAAEDIDASIVRARALVEQSKLQDAISLLKTTEVIAPENKKMAVYLELGVDLRKTGNYRESIEYYGRAAKLSPKMADIYYNIGLAYYYQILDLATRPSRLP